MSGLNDAEVQKQIDQMVKFIENEGREKADEIDTTAEEDFNIEKLRIVQGEKKAIQALHSRRQKQAEVEKKIARSNQLNQARLQILKAQDDHLQSIFAEVKTKIDAISSDANKYGTILKKLIIEGLLALNEKKITLKCRQSDVAAVKKQIPAAIKEATALNGIETKIELSEKNFLPETCGGGVEFNVSNGKIKITNTLENRLDNACTQTLPAVRNLLFGASESRAFFE